MNALRIRLTRLTNDRHRFEAIRPNGEIEMRELETRSFLLHDLVHFAVETEAGLQNSFYGQLARGAGYEGMDSGGEGASTEMVVGPLQGAVKGEVDPKSFVELLRGHFSNIGSKPPAWLTEDLIVRALERLRGLQGAWRATPFGQTLELEFPLS